MPPTTWMGHLSNYKSFISSPTLNQGAPPKMTKGEIPRSNSPVAAAIIKPTFDFKDPRGNC